MQTQFGFTSYTIPEFMAWLPSITVSRTITTVQEHHTWSPNYSGFAGSNHFDMQRAMKNHHVNNNGWSDIGQHFSIFPDGLILTGRPMANTPACIYNNNSNSVCIENVGDFDAGRDAMRPEQRDSIIAVTAALLRRFSLGAPTVNNIVYHHWFDLNSGARTNGLSGSTKSCPGTAFFGGNKVPDCEQNFLPLVASALNGQGGSPPPVAVQEYVVVTANSLAVRTGPGSHHPEATDTDPAILGAVLRVYARNGNWLKISSSKERWVSKSRTEKVRRATVNTPESNCRIGPGTQFAIVTVFQTGDVVFVQRETNGWSRIGFADTWIKSSLLTFG